jgi:enterochelin esterase family protein
VLPRLREEFATSQRPVLTGQSLGALAALHAAWTSPTTFAGLLLQSGSFFTAELDAQESSYAKWAEVTGFVRSVHAATAAAPGAPPTMITCGTAEENLANNRLLAEHLRTTGVDVSWGETRQGHTWTCWRDLLDPHLTDLLTRVWRT